MSKAGGGRGTNQHAVKGVSQVRAQGSAVVDDLAEESELTIRTYYPNTTQSVFSENHFRDGELHDPADGRPAERYYFPDGSVASERHYRNGKMQDPPDGTPAMRMYRADGSVGYEAHHPVRKVRHARGTRRMP